MLRTILTATEMMFLRRETMHVLRSWEYFPLRIPACPLSVRFVSWEMESLPISMKSTQRVVGVSIFSLYSSLGHSSTKTLLSSRIVPSSENDTSESRWLLQK